MYSILSKRSKITILMINETATSQIIITKTAMVKYISTDMSIVYLRAFYQDDGYLIFV